MPSPIPGRPAFAAAVHTDKPSRAEPMKKSGEKEPVSKSNLATRHFTDAVAGNQGAGARNSAGASSKSNGQSSGGGAGDSGNGNTAEICGTVDFESSESPTYNRKTGYYERRDIIATVYYADGTSKRVPLDWIWRYHDEVDDPLRVGSTAPMLFQFPPPVQRASEPPAVQYIMAHTTPTGRTQIVDECPRASSLESPRPTNALLAVEQDTLPY